VTAAPIPAALDAEQPYLALALLRNLRVARSVIVLVILVGLVLPHVVADLALYQPAWTGPAWFLGLLAVAVTDAVLVARRRTWGSARWPAAAFVLGLSVWATALLPAAALVGPPHQTLGAVGWFGVLLLADTGIGALLGFLGVHVALTVVQLGLAGRLDLLTLVDLAVAATTTGRSATAGCARASCRSCAGWATAACRPPTRRCSGALHARRRDCGGCSPRRATCSTRSPSSSVRWWTSSSSAGPRCGSPRRGSDPSRRPRPAGRWSTPSRPRCWPPATPHG